MRIHEMDARRRAAGSAHRDAFPNNQRTADLFGLNRSTTWRWGEGDPSPLVKFAEYVIRCSPVKRFRIVAWLNALVKKEAVRDLTTRDLVTRYRALLAMESKLEAEDRTYDTTPEACWTQRQAASEKDGAINLEKAALAQEFNARRLSWYDVMGPES